MLKHDPIEDNEELREIFNNVDSKIERYLKEKGIEKGLGYIHIFDKYKKKVLKERYNIDWKTTQEMNPNIIID